MAVQLEQVEDLSIITMDDGKANAMNPNLVRALSGALDEAMGSRAVVLTGTNKVFSGGLDLKLLHKTSTSQIVDFLNEFNSFLEQLLFFPRPLVAACGGHAVGAGCLLLLACDVRLGTPSGRVGISGIQLGLPFPSWAIAVARCCLNQQDLNRALLQGEVLSGSERLTIGYLTEIVPEEDLRSASLERAALLSRVDLRVFASTRTRLREHVATQARASADAQNQLFVEAISSPETQARVEAMLSRVSRDRSP
jgi:enoyl-CoA hydratase